MCTKHRRGFYKKKCGDKRMIELLEEEHNSKRITFYSEYL